MAGAGEEDAAGVAKVGAVVGVADVAPASASLRRGEPVYRRFAEVARRTSDFGFEI